MARIMAPQGLSLKEFPYLTHIHILHILGHYNLYGPLFIIELIWIYVQHRPDQRIGIV